MAINIPIPFQSKREKFNCWLVKRSWLQWWWNWKYQQRNFPCFSCRKFTKWLVCDNCTNIYCLGHCDWDNEGSWEMSQPDYPICPKCMEN